MKNRFLILIASLFFTIGALAQSSERIGSHESIAKWNPSSTTSFTNSTQGRNIVQEIIDIVGLKPNFEVREANIPNAAAVTYAGKRYILYNPNFITQLEKSTGTKWAAISVLAHEIGHHLNGHTITPSGTPQQSELEADEFSGFVLRRMGAGLADAQAAMKKLATINASRTHPGQNDRLTSIADGWNKADAQIAGRKYEPKTKPVANTQPVAVNRNPAPTQRQTAIDDRNIIGDVRFKADPNSSYYVTTRYNLVRVKNNQLAVIGKLAQLNSNKYPYLIYDEANTQLLVDVYGNILTKQGAAVGKLSARRG